MEELGDKEGMKTFRGLVEKMARSSIPEQVPERDIANYWVSHIMAHPL